MCLERFYGQTYGTWECYGGLLSQGFELRIYDGPDPLLCSLFHVPQYDDDDDDDTKEHCLYPLKIPVRTRRGDLHGNRERGRGHNGDRGGGGGGGEGREGERGGGQKTASHSEPPEQSASYKKEQEKGGGGGGGGGGEKLPFDKIFVINLDKRKDRWRHIRKELKRIDLMKYVERISAVDGSKIDLEALRQEGSSGENGEKQPATISNHAYESLTQLSKDELVFGHDLTRGALGCALSHINIWRRIVSEKLQRVLVLEDDAHFSHNFRQDLEARISHVPDDWGVIYLAHLNVKDGVFWHPDQGFVGLGVQYANADTRTTVAYIVNYEAAKRLLQVTIPLYFQVDTHMTSFVAFQSLNKPPGSNPPKGFDANKIEEAVVDPRSYVLEPPLVVQLRNYGSDVQPKDMHSDAYEEFMLGRLKESDNASNFVSLAAANLPNTGIPMKSHLKVKKEKKKKKKKEKRKRTSACSVGTTVIATWEDGSKYPGRILEIDKKRMTIVWDGEDTYSFTDIMKWLNPFNGHPDVAMQSSGYSAYVVPRRCYRISAYTYM
eukprot:jgi/Bigna1/125320/aug1.1_g28